MSNIQLSVLLLLLLTILCLLTTIGLTDTINCDTSLDENTQVVLNSRDSHVVDDTTNVTTSVLLEGWSLFDIDRFNYSTISFNVTFTDMFSWGQNTGLGTCSPIFSICDPFDLMDPTMQGEDNWVVSSFFFTDGESIHVQLTCANPGATVPSNLDCRSATSVMYYETDALAPIQIDTLSYFTPAIVESSVHGILSASFTKSKLGFYLAFNNSGLCTNILETLITYFQCSATNGYNNIGSLPNTSAPNVTHQPLQIQFTCPTSSTGLIAECYANGSWAIPDSIACDCNAGYRVASQSSAYSCEACPIDTYKQSIGNTNCTVCPANSHTNGVTGETGCVCRDGFFRGEGESVVMSCGTSPSAPRNLTVERVSSNSTELTLRWDEPSSLGGRDISLLAYEVSYSKTSSPINLTVLNQTSNSEFVFMNGFLTASTEYILTVMSLNNLNAVSNVTNNNSVTVLSSSPIVSSIMYSPNESLLYFAYRLDRAGDYIIQLTYSTLPNIANMMLNVSFSSNCICSTVDSCSCTLYNVSNLNYSLPITIEFFITSLTIVNITPTVTDTITLTTTATITTTISATATVTAATDSTAATTTGSIAITLVTSFATLPTSDTRTISSVQEGITTLAPQDSTLIVVAVIVPIIIIIIIIVAAVIVAAVIIALLFLQRYNRKGKVTEEPPVYYEITTNSEDPIYYYTPIASSTVRDTQIELQITTNSEDPTYYYTPMASSTVRDTQIVLPNNDQKTPYYNVFAQPNYENLAPISSTNQIETAIDSTLPNTRAPNRSQNKMPYEKFISLYEQYMKSDELNYQSALIAQFSELSSEAKKIPMTSQLAARPENVYKNHVATSLLCDSTGVDLSACNYEGTYINTTYISSEYIVTMHPTSNTVADFVRLLYQTRPVLCVLLTTPAEKIEMLSDRSEPKAYWPLGDEELKFIEAFSIKWDEKKRLPFGLKQELTITHMIDNMHITLTQLISEDWEETGQSTNLSRAVQLIDYINSAQARDNCNNRPIIVHCTDAIGKSGVLLTVLLAINEAKDTGTIDIVQAIKSLRSKRSNIVPTIEHFNSCYALMNDYCKNKCSGNLN